MYDRASDLEIGFPPPELPLPFPTHQPTLECPVTRSLWIRKLNLESGEEGGLR